VLNCWVDVVEVKYNAGGVELRALVKILEFDDYIFESSMGLALDPPHLWIGSTSSGAFRSSICGFNGGDVHFQRQDLQYAQHYAALWVSNFYLRSGLCGYL
jgi:hypothetical protein